MNAIEVRDLRKSYGDFEAVKGITFDVPEGSFFAFLGPNGAGKSTTISMICSLLSPDSGEISIFGQGPEVSRRDMGVIFQENMLDPRLTVRENVTVRGSMYGFGKDELAAKVQTALEDADALEFADRPYGKLSGGQRRRADIARALVHCPKILLLDEPTAGLDPQTRKHIWNTVYELKRKGMTVFLTTHYMEEAAEADDIVIIDKGMIVAHGIPSVLKDSYCSDYMTVVPKDMASADRALSSAGSDHEMRGDSLFIRLRSTKDAIPLIEMLKDNIVSFEVRTGSLDDAFIAITGDDFE